MWPHCFQQENLQNEKPRTGRGFLLARQVGVEPTTIRLTVERSATELLPNTLRSKAALANFSERKDSSLPPKVQALLGRAGAHHAQNVSAPAVLSAPEPQTAVWTPRPLSA